MPLRDVSLNPWWAEGLMLRDGMSVEAVLDATAAMGVGWYDVQEAFLGLSPHPDPVALARLRRAATASGVQVLSSWFYADVLGVTALTSVDTVVEHLRRYLVIAAGLESRYLVIQNGEPGPGVDVAQARAALLRVYEGIADDAEELGVTVCMEAARAASPFNSPSGALSLVEEFDSPWITVAPDFEAWRVVSTRLPSGYVENPGMSAPDPLTVEDFARCLPRAPFVHAKFLEPDDRGEDPNYPARELLELVRQDRAPHDVSVEYEGWLPEVHPDRDPVACAAASVTFVTSFGTPMPASAVTR